MLKLLVASALPLLVGLGAALLGPREWAFDIGVFYGFLATLAIVAALAVNSVVVRLSARRDGGFFGPGPLTMAQAFWATMTINLSIGYLILRLGESEYRTDSYAIGAGALLPHAIGIFAALVCLTFVLIRWWPLRLFLATASGCSAAFACMAITWWR